MLPATGTTAISSASGFVNPATLCVRPGEGMHHQTQTSPRLRAPSTSPGARYLPIKIEPATRTYARDIENTRSLWGAAGLFLRFPTPRILASKIVAFVFINLWLANYSWGDLFIVAGVALYWPFQEWFLHCFLLHFKPRRVALFLIDPYAARMHRYHHRNPWLLETTFLPFQFILVLIPLHIGLWWALMPTLAHAATGILFFTIATLIYEWVHYLTHTPYKPRSRYFREVCRNHRLHHFKNERYWHSFTSPAVDRLFGTCPSPDTTPNSPTCRTLGYDYDKVGD